MHLRRFLLLACLAMAGCDYSVSLVSEPGPALDPNLVGRWSGVPTKPDDKPAALLILPFATNQFLVKWPADKPDGLYARATRCTGTAMPLIQLEWFGTGDGTTPDLEEKENFQYATYTLRGRSLEIALLNPEVITKEVADAATLRTQLDAHAANPRLFREPMRFTRSSKESTTPRE